MNNLELYNYEHLRLDGRRWNELRRFSMKFDTNTKTSDGYASVTHGNTFVRCIVNGPMEPSLKSQQNVREASLECSISIPNFLNTDQKKNSKNKRQIIEHKTLIEKTFEHCIIRKQYPGTVISIHLQILADDGGLLAAMINATNLALLNSGIQLVDYVSCVTVGFYNLNFFLDLNILEESKIPCLTIATFGNSTKIITASLNGKISIESLEAMISIALTGCHKLKDLMEMKIRKTSLSSISKEK